MTRIALLLAIAALTAAPAFARPAEGTNLALKSVPPFLTRVFVPVVAGTNNSFAVESLPIQQILETPAPYRLAFEQLREKTGRALDPRRSVAIEDSRWGLESARGAGLRLVGVTSSYSAGELSSAELVVDGLATLTLPALDELCAS